MRFIPLLIFHYLASHVDPKETHTIGKNRKAAIVFRYSVKSWIKWPMENINRLQSEIYGFKRVARYSGYPSCSCLVEIPILRSVLYEGAECDTALINNRSNGDEDVS